MSGGRRVLLSPALIWESCLEWATDCALLSNLFLSLWQLDSLSTSGLSQALIAPWFPIHSVLGVSGWYQGPWASDHCTCDIQLCFLMQGPHYEALNLGTDPQWQQADLVTEWCTTVEGYVVQRAQSGSSGPDSNVSAILTMQAAQSSLLSEPPLPHK